MVPPEYGRVKGAGEVGHQLVSRPTSCCRPAVAVAISDGAPAA